MSWDTIYDLLQINTPFCFIKMNDGEINCIVNKTGLSRGAQDYNDNMDKILYDALIYKAKNYFVGIPCKLCYESLYNYCIEKVEDPYPANLLINSNFKKSDDMFRKILPERNVVFVCSENANIEKLPFVPINTIRVPDINSWEKFDELKNMYTLFTKGTLVLFCCGPLGRGLAYEWYKNNPDITCIELGSFYDPWTRGKAYQYQLGNHKKCLECCKVNSEPISDELIKSCYYLERVYWDNIHIDTLRNIYGNDNITLKNVYSIINKKPKDMDEEYYSEWQYTKFLIDEISDTNEKYLKIKTYLDYAINKWTDRIEGYFEMAYMLPVNEKMEYLWKVAHINNTNYKYNDYDLNVWKLLDNIVIDEYYRKNYRKSHHAWTIMMDRKSQIPAHYLEHCINNGKYAIEYIKGDLQTEKFLDELDKIEIIQNNEQTIPKIFHFIYITGHRPFTMSHYVAVKSCLVVQKPKQIYVWYSEENDSLQNNKWWNKTKDIAIFNKVTIPCSLNSTSIPFPHHKADYMRINILYKFGGIYMDLDILSYKNLDGSEIPPQFENPDITDPNLYNKELVMCRESNDKISNAVIMAKKGNMFLKYWIDKYNTEYDSNWSKLSVETPHKMYLENIEKNICILKTQTFLPFSYLDFRFFDHDGTDWLINNSILIHLWDTESFKYNKIPLDEKYYETNDNSTFTKNFKKYTDEI